MERGVTRSVASSRWAGRLSLATSLVGGGRRRFIKLPAYGIVLNKTGRWRELTESRLAAVRIFFTRGI